MGNIGNIFKNVVSSGGIIGYGSTSNYVADLTRRAIGMGFAQFQDGQVQYFSKDFKILKRAAIQRTHQLAYGTLRSYPRYIRYWESKERDKHIEKYSQTSIANKEGQYFKLIEQQKAIVNEKNYADTIVGTKVLDYLELSISSTGSYYNSKTNSIESNSTYGVVTFADLQPIVTVSSKNNVLLTVVQGRDYTRKEFISGGDLEINISGKITSKYPDVYPDAEVSKFLKLMQYRGVIACDNTILRQFKIEKLIVLNYSLPQSDFRNIQPYTLNCVAVEPSEAIELKIAEEEKVQEAFEYTNKWIKLVRFGTKVVDPSSLLKISRLWI